MGKGFNTKDIGLNINAYIFYSPLGQILKIYERQEFLNDPISISSTTVPFQSVTATRWVPFMTGVMAQASASAKTVLQGPNVTTVCRDTTGNKAVTVSIRTLIFGGLLSKNMGMNKCCILLGPLQVHCVI